MDKHIDSSMILVNDLKKMMKISIPENTPPYEKASIDYTNKMIDDFFRDVVSPNAISGRINAVWATDAWGIYQDGKETEIMWSLRDELFKVSKEQMEYWKSVFELPVEDMLKIGRSTLLYGHEILTMWYRKWLMETKYQSFYSEPDVEKWIRKKDDINEFERNKELCPIDIYKYTQKMQSIMKYIRQFKTK